MIKTFEGFEQELKVGDYCIFLLDEYGKDNGMPNRINHKCSIFEVYKFWKQGKSVPYYVVMFDGSHISEVVLGSNLKRVSEYGKLKKKSNLDIDPYGEEDWDK